MKSKQEKRDRGIFVLFMLGIFLFTAMFFLRFRPLVPDNGDDWAYMAFSRSALPKWGSWNPGKVFPEIFLPLCAQIAVNFVMPLCGDYIGSISLTVGVVTSLMITLYIGLFALLLRQLLRLDMGTAALIAAGFFLFHFMSWMSKLFASRHLFFSPDMNNTFNYVIPGLLNISLLLIFERRRDPALAPEKPSVLGQGAMLLLVYLAIFSNMFLNGILAVYAGVGLLENLATALRRREKPDSFLRRNAWNIGILVMWCVCAVFEMNGGRAHSVSGETQSLFMGIKLAFWRFRGTIKLMNPLVFSGSLGLIAAGLILLLASHGQHAEDGSYARLMLRHAACALLTAVYLILLGGVAGRVYMERVDILFAAVVHVLILAGVSAGYLLRRFPKAAIVLPAAVLILVVEICLGMDSFELGNTGNTTQHVLAVNRNLVEQVVAADRQGQQEMTLIVPKMPTEDNFPYPEYMGFNMCRTLRQHRMIENIHTIHIQPDEQYYTIFGMVPGENAYSRAGQQ